MSFTVMKYNKNNIEEHEKSENFLAENCISYISASHMEVYP